MSDIIYFLHHSGFIYENETSLLVFDFYKDPENRLETLLKDSKKKLYFFVSHYHADHFNRDIRRWEERAEAYIMHKNCWLTMDREEKKHLMVPGDTLTIGDLTVTMYGSTDEGGSFLVKSGGKTIFHAGDLNWWHWEGEPDEKNTEMRRIIWPPGGISSMSCPVFPKDRSMWPFSRWMLGSRRPASGASWHILKG